MENQKHERQQRRYYQQNKLGIDCHRIHKALMAEKNEAEHKLNKFYQHLEKFKIQIRRNPENNFEKTDLPEKKEALENNIKHEEMRSKYIKEMFEKYPVDEVQNIKEPEVRSKIIKEMVTKITKEDQNIECPEPDLEFNCKSLYNKELDSKMRPSPVSSEEQLISNTILSEETKIDEVKLNLIKSKTLLIDLIDKEIQKFSNQTGDQGIGETGAGGDTQKIDHLKIRQRELKEKRLKSIATIKKELEILENLDFEEIA